MPRRPDTRQSAADRTKTAAADGNDASADEPEHARDHAGNCHCKRLRRTRQGFAVRISRPGFTGCDGWLERAAGARGVIGNASGVGYETGAPVCRGFPNANSKGPTCVLGVIHVDMEAM